MDGFNVIVSFWGPAYVQGLWLLVSGSVFPYKISGSIIDQLGFLK